MRLFLLTMMMLLSSMMGVKGAVDPNFYIYLCFGQSNMEGNAQWEVQDNYVDPRFQMLATCNFSNPNRTMGNWYTANCPIVSPDGRLGPTDYFGRTMVAAMPSDVKIGVLAVAMGGSPIEMFDKDKYQQKLSENPNEWWATLAKRHYGGNPYGRLIEMGKKAKEVGVIKGILLHQGESNNGDPNWPNMVKKIYNDMLADLGLQASDVPLFVGEVEYTGVGTNSGGCAAHNVQVARIPSVIPTGHVVSAEGVPGNNTDPWHFSAAGYRILGKRYAFEVLKALGRETRKDAGYALPDNLQKFFGVSSLNCDDVTVRVGGSKKLDVTVAFVDGHIEHVNREATFSSNDFPVSAEGVVSITEAKTGVVTITYTDFMGTKHTKNVTVTGSDQGPNHVLEVNNGAAGTNAWDRQCNVWLNVSMQIGKTYIVKATIRSENSGECALWPIWTASPNRNQWDGSTDVQYLAAYQLNNQWQEFTWEFTAQFTNDKIQFAIGKIGGKIYFDDVSCVEKGTTTNMVPNGTFESDDISKWEIITWAGQKLSVVEDNTTRIAPITTQRSPLDAQGYYTLDGRRLNGQPTQRGLYIVNGKKMLISK